MNDRMECITSSGAVEENMYLTRENLWYAQSFSIINNSGAAKRIFFSEAVVNEAMGRLECKIAGLTAELEYVKELLNKTKSDYKRAVNLNNYLFD